MKWCVVVPTNRPEKFKEFYAAWRILFEKYEINLIIVEDVAEPSDFSFTNVYTKHLTWADVPDFIPRKTDMIRSWGFYQAWKQKLGHYVLTLDDDTVPNGDVFAAYEQAFTNGSVLSEYFSVGSLTSSSLQMRGFPYKDRKLTEVAVQYGGWSGVLDYDAATQLAVPQYSQIFHDYVIPMPKGAAATCCIMNCAFAVEYTPIMWQLTMVDGRYNRIGDIWSGLFIKRTLDAIGKVMLVNGKAGVIHNRASDPYTSLVKEAPSVYMNDNIWERLPRPNTVDMIQAYTEVTDVAIAFYTEHDTEYAKQFKKDRDLWLNLFPVDEVTW